MSTAEQATHDVTTKLPKETIAFKHGATVKFRVSEIAKKSNLSEATVGRLVFNAGLEALYGLKVENNEIID